MFDKRLKLGTYLGIGLYVHWTFLLLLGFVAYQAREYGTPGMIFSVAVALGIFSCVTLHEYGHAMAARMYGISTVDITLFPIGGVARLERMPRIPFHELVVAVAGPAVNVVIGSLLVVGMYVFAWQPVMDLFGSLNDVDPLQTPSLVGFLFIMLMANIALVVFNMVPAFPMDGGRVFRSLLAMVTSYGKATYIASRVGLVCAGMMALFALNVGNPITLLIALFIAYAGVAEARQVDLTESVRGSSIYRSMIHDPPSILMDTPLSEIRRIWSRVTVSELPVISISGSVVGVLRLADVAKAIEKGEDGNSTAGQLADHGVVTVKLDDDIESVVLTAGRGNRTVPVVDSSERLIGLLDLQTLADRGRISAATSDPGELPSSQLDIIH